MSMIAFLWSQLNVISNCHVIIAECWLLMLNNRKAGLIIDNRLHNLELWLQHWAFEYECLIENRATILQNVRFSHWLLMLSLTCFVKFILFAVMFATVAVYCRKHQCLHCLPSPSPYVWRTLYRTGRGIPGLSCLPVLLLLSNPVLAWCIDESWTFPLPPCPPIDIISTCDDCLEDKREDNQNCSVLHCVPQLYTIISTHIWPFLTSTIALATADY